MPLAKRLREERERAGMTLDQLAEKAEVSKTYLWELEKDAKGQKKPSADVLLRIAEALSLTIADLLSLPAVRVDETKVEISQSLIEFRSWMKKIGEPLSESDMRELATMRFRGGQPKTRDNWHDLYRILKRST